MKNPALYLILAAATATAGTSSLAGCASLANIATAPLAFPKAMKIEFEENSEKSFLLNSLNSVRYGTLYSLMKFAIGVGGIANPSLRAYLPNEQMIRLGNMYRHEREYKKKLTEDNYSKQENNRREIRMRKGN